MKTIEITYLGRRMGKGSRLIYAYSFYGEEKTRYYKEPIVPAKIGERWKVTEIDDKGSIHVRGEHRPVCLDSFHGSDAKIAEWEALDAAHAQEAGEQRAASKLAKRKSQFEAYMEPLERMFDSLQTVNERHYFINAVTKQLLRRRVP